MDLDHFGYDDGTEDGEPARCVPIVDPIYPQDIADLAGPEVDPAIVERAAAVMARQESARAVGELLRHLPAVLPYVALRRVLLGSNGESGRADAEKLGVSHTTLRRWERYLKVALRVPLEHPRNPHE